MTESVTTYDPSKGIAYRHTDTLSGYAQARFAEMMADRTRDVRSLPTVSANGLATWQGDIDPLTGDRVLTAWALPIVPVRSA